MLALRLPFAAVSGVLFSLAVFFGLWQLVSVPFDPGQPVAARNIDYTPQRPDTPIDNKREPKVEREPPPITPLPTDIGWHNIGVTGVTNHVEPRIDVVRPPPGGMMVGSDRDVLPLVRVAPDYPPRAIASNTEGWVQVEFSITATGAVRDAVVVASEPGTVFDEAALKAIARWRYNPRVEGGVAVERVGLRAVIRFELEQ